MQRIRLHSYILHFIGQKAHRVPLSGLSEGKERVLQENVGRTREQKEQEVELCLSVSDLLSLAGFRTKFTSFHDIAKAQLSVELPSQNTQVLER